MITEIEIEGFKSLEKVHLKLGKFNLFVGANASGKSNFFDALRVLQGIGYGFTIDEIFNGRPKSSTSEVWEGIRGGSARAAFVKRGAGSLSNSDLTIKLLVSLQSSGSPNFEFEIEISPQQGLVLRETLRADSEKIAQHRNSLVRSMATASEMRNLPRDFAAPFVMERRLLHASFSRDLGNVQRIEPSPVTLRKYSQYKTVKRMGEDGENFAALVQSITENSKSKGAYLSWLRQLTPVELDDITILKGSSG